MIENIKHTLDETLTITVFVFVMMVIIDYLNVVTHGKMSNLIKGGKFKQYILSAIS